MERRKHPRFAATAFLNRQVTVTPIQPFIGRPIKGKLIDLAAGGLSILISHIIPQDTVLHLKLTFPDHSILETDTQVKHMVPRGRGYLHGIEFLNLDALVVERIKRMSNDYIDCESRIQAKALEVCKGAECAFFTMCTKPERSNLILSLRTENSLILDFKQKTPSICAQPK